MRPLTFSPGPSRISDNTCQDIAEISNSGFLEASHRSQGFSNTSSNCLKNLRSYLGVPDNYHVFFLDSATNAWHSITANTVSKKSFHIIQGDFSGKAQKASQALYKDTSSETAPHGEQHDFSAIDISDDNELITACYNESSTGVTMNTEDITTLRKRFPNQLIAIDITSCAAAISLPIQEADLWYFSVQKGFGLPPGLGVLIVSPQAYNKSITLEDSKENMAGIWRWSNYAAEQDKQPGFTIQTPNTLNICLLHRKLNRLLKKGGIKAIEADTKKKIERLWDFIDKHPDLEHYVNSEKHRSLTMSVIQASAETIKKLEAKALERNIVIGKGYGQLASSTFRLANFPSITNEHIDDLINALQ